MIGCQIFYASLPLCACAKPPRRRVYEPEGIALNVLAIFAAISLPQIAAANPLCSGGSCLPYICRARRQSPVPLVCELRQSAAIPLASRHPFRRQCCASLFCSIRVLLKADG